MCGYTRDPVIHSKFHRNPFRGFGAPGDQILALPITLASRFYNSLYYRTSRDYTVSLNKQHVGLACNSMEYGTDQTLFFEDRIFIEIN